MAKSQPNTATVMYRVAGRTYPMKVVNGCGVCHSPWRTAAENFIVLGYSFEKASSELPAEAGISAEQLRHHFKTGHLPLQEEARRVLIERRATELHWDVNEEADRLVDHITFLRSGVQDVFTRMQTRQIEPDVKDGIQMARALAQIDIDRETEDNLGMYVTGIRVLMQSARKIMTQEQFALFSRDVMEDPAIQSLIDSGPTHRAPHSSPLALETGEAV